MPERVQIVTNIQKIAPDAEDVSGDKQIRIQTSPSENNDGVNLLITGASNAIKALLEAEDALYKLVEDSTPDELEANIRHLIQSCSSLAGSIGKSIDEIVNNKTATVTFESSEFAEGLRGQEEVDHSWEVINDDNTVAGNVQILIHGLTPAYKQNILESEKITFSEIYRFGSLKNAVMTKLLWLTPTENLIIFDESTDQS